jgi:putative ABC transport system ATP-binding protein
MDLSRANDRQLTQFRREHVGFVFQFFNLVPSLTALENVEVSLELTANGLPALDVLAQVGLAERAHHFPSQLSGGEQQRVAIARALAKDPRLLLCDEPTGAVDSVNGRRILRILYDLNREQGKTVVVITHDHTVAHIAHRVATIHDGRITDLRENASPVDPDELTM